MAFGFGTTIDALVEVRNAAGALVDADSIVCQTRAPSGALVTIDPGDVAYVSLGRYRFSIVGNEGGTWLVNCSATIDGKVGYAGPTLPSFDVEYQSF